ncbi:MAG TPA: hypothetical protein VMI06_04780 [Terriglobia bacterium]|nr:hypothetical protein [Terriglobia bacterium]
MFARLLTGIVLGLLLCGCSNSAMGPEGVVSGKVNYQGKPLPGGRVTFLTSKGLVFSDVIDPEGNYKIKATVGEAKLAVDNSMLNKSNQPTGPDLRHPPGVKPPPGVKVDDEKSSAPTVTGTYVAIPQKYQSPDASGLTYSVKAGSQTHDIELSDRP